MGGTAIWDPAPSREQFLMHGLQAAAFGSCGLLYWTGDPWRGGHWPHWGGLLDWSGHPEPDFAWAVELGKIFDQWGPCLIENPVKATTVALDDFEQRAALEIYPHTKASPTVLCQSFGAMHRLGVGVGCMNLAKAASASNLAQYSLVLVPAATALDDLKVIVALRDFAQHGGIVVITPFTAYQDKDGIFRGDGFGANLRELAGGLVRTVRSMGMESASQNMDPAVEWLGAGMMGPSPVGLEGNCEFLEVDPEAEVVARFKSRLSIVNGRPATTVRKLGRGRVVKLAWWPGDDSLLGLVRQLLSGGRSLLAAPVPVGVLAVPHADDSLFIVNTTRQKMSVRLAHGLKERISGGSLGWTAILTPFQVVWLEQIA